MDDLMIDVHMLHNSIEIAMYFIYNIKKYDGELREQLLYGKITREDYKKMKDLVEPIMININHLNIQTNSFGAIFLIGAAGDVCPRCGGSGRI